MDRVQAFGGGPPAIRAYHFLSVFIAFKKTFGATQSRPKDLGRHACHLVINQTGVEAASGQQRVVGA
jgi:hypothetical protein